MKKIGLFFGCFDPVHRGHIRAAEMFRTAAELDRVLLVPANTQYRKFFGPSAGGVHRLNMCVLAAGGHEGIDVCDFEVRSPRLPYTTDTVKYIRTRIPGAEIFLCAGEDTANALPRWACFPELREWVALLVISRAGGPGHPAELFRSGAKVLYIDAETDGISSTAVRRRLWAGERVIPELDENVLCYIRENSLYRNQGK